MAIPDSILIKNNKLPDNPGVYLYYDESGKLLYVGKATSLKKRVGSYFSKKYQKHDDTYSRRIGKMVSEIVRIDYIETPTVIEALVLEANLIRARKPYYNVMLTDDKSFLFLVFTNEPFPKPIYKRGLELAREGVSPFMTTQEIKEQVGDKYLAVFGPFTSPFALRKSMDLLRKIFPWSTCEPPEGEVRSPAEPDRALRGEKREVRGEKRPRACFYRHIRQCPGVCTGVISAKEYKKNIRGLVQFFEGKKPQLIKRLTRQMMKESDALRFEEANVLKRQVRWLEHIRDISVITQDFSPLPYENPDTAFVDGLGHVEAYDISNTSGTQATGSMVVFEHGAPKKSAYRKFKIKTVKGPNDVACMKEMLRRRLKRAEQFPKAWKLPDVMVIDGGKPQVNAATEVVKDEFGLGIPIVGLAKGPDRKQDVLVFDKSNEALAKIAHGHKETFQKARDEAHRFAVKYHRELRRKRHR